MTFVLLITVVAVFMAVRWSVKQPLAAHEFYTAIERMFQKRK